MYKCFHNVAICVLKIIAVTAQIPLSRVGQLFFSSEQLEFEKSYLPLVHFTRITLLGIDIYMVDMPVPIIGNSVNVTVSLSQLRLEEVEDYAPTFRDLRRRNLSSGIFVDVGANVGTISILLARLSPRATVLALEPNRELFRLFIWNLKLNGLMYQIWPINSALGGLGCNFTTFSFETFYFDKVADTSECFSVSDIFSFLSANSAIFHRRQVQSYSRSPHVDLFKIDCEGCEYAAFKTPESRQLLENHVQDLVGEVHPCLGKRTSSIEALITLCRRHDGKLNLAMKNCQCLAQYIGMRAGNRVPAPLADTLEDLGKNYSC